MLSNQPSAVHYKQATQAAHLNTRLPSLSDTVTAIFLWPVTQQFSQILRAAQVVSLTACSTALHIDVLQGNKLNLAQKNYELWQFYGIPTIEQAVHRHKRPVSVRQAVQWHKTSVKGRHRCFERFHSTFIFHTRHVQTVKLFLCIP